MAALGVQRFPWSSRPPDNYSGRPSPKVFFGLRTGPRKPLWRSRNLSTEAINAVQALKFAKSTSKLEHVLLAKLGRLLKADAIAALAELQRQNELEISLKVFDFMRGETWYRPDAGLYADMILLAGRNKMVSVAEEFLAEMEEEGLEPDARIYSEMINAYFGVSMVDRAMEMYGKMKAAGCKPDKLTFVILINGLEKAGEEELTCSVKKDYKKYVDH